MQTVQQVFEAPTAQPFVMVNTPICAEATRRVDPEERAGSIPEMITCTGCECACLCPWPGADDG